MVERRLLARLGVYVEEVTSTAEAVRAIGLASRSVDAYAVAVSDMSRPGDPGRART